MRVGDLCFFFFFQAEDGIRDLTVTGVQTCALPICPRVGRSQRAIGHLMLQQVPSLLQELDVALTRRELYPVAQRRERPRSEERRVGKECRSRWSPDQ